MLDALKELGLIDSPDGKLTKEEEILLLHIYKSKLEGVSPELVETQAEINSGKLTDYCQLLSDEVAPFFADGFNKGIEKIHAKLVKNRAEDGSEYVLKASRKHGELCVRMKQIKNAINNSRQDLELMKGWLSDEKGFEAFCSSRDIAPNESMKTMLKSAYEAKQSEFNAAKVRALNFSVGFLIADDVQTGRFVPQLAS